MNNNNGLSPDPINPLTNDTPNNTAAPQKKGLSTLAVVTIAIVAIPVAIILFFILGITNSIIKDKSPDDYLAYIEKRYGSSEDFAYKSDGNTYMGHYEKIFVSNRTGKTFTVTKDSGSFGDNYWETAYESGVNDYLEDIFSEVTPYKMSLASKGNLDSGSSIPNSTEDIAKSSNMWITIVMTVDFSTFNFHDDEDVRENGLDTTAYNEKVTEVLNKYGLKSIRGVELVLSNYSYAGECPEGTTLMDNKCRATIYPL